MILFRYLAREILISLFAVSVTLLVIVMSSRFVKYLAQAATGDLAPEVVFSIMAYRLPSFLELVLPLGLFIGILLAYGRLYVESEMTVMSACGLSTSRLAFYTLIPSVFVGLLVAWLSLYASPTGIAKVQDIFQDAKNSSGLELLVSGRFRVDEKSGRVTYVERLDKDRTTMQYVFSAQQQKQGQGLELQVVIAEQASIDYNPEHDSRFLVLKNGGRYVGKPGGLAFQTTLFEEFGQRLDEPRQSRSSYTKADGRTTKQLLESKRLEDKATLQWRISLAILVPIIALIAQALSRTTHRRGRYVKMLPAFLIYIIYLVVLNAAREAIVDEKLPLILGMWWIHGVFLWLALMLLYGGDWWRMLTARRSAKAIGPGEADA